MQDLACLFVIAALAAACGAGAAQSPSSPPTADKTDPAKPRASDATPQSTPSATVASAPSAAPEDAVPALALPITVKVSGTKAEMSSDEAKDLMLTFDVTNTGDRPIHAGLEKSVLLVNGKPHNGFKETVEEIKDDKWDSLGPGETARFHYKFVARGSVKPGEYSFVLQVGLTLSKPFVIHVNP